MAKKTRCYRYKNDLRIRQGDIIKDVRYFENFTIEAKILELNYVDFPYVYVLTQECDLDVERNNRGKHLKDKGNGKVLIDDNNYPIIDSDKSLVSILVAPIYNFDVFSKGIHLSEVCKVDKRDYNTYRSSELSKKLMNKYKNNDHNRYHYIELEKTDVLSPSIIDFKHYFTINLHELETLKSSNYTTTVSKLFRENISQRFSNYLSRIGLPVVK
jgi:hypothetical protein